MAYPSLDHPALDLIEDLLYVWNSLQGLSCGVVCGLTYSCDDLCNSRIIERACKGCKPGHLNLIADIKRHVQPLSLGSSAKILEISSVGSVYLNRLASKVKPTATFFRKYSAPSPIRSQQVSSGVHNILGSDFPTHGRNHAIVALGRLNRCYLCKHLLRLNFTCSEYLYLY